MTDKEALAKIRDLLIEDLDDFDEMDEKRFNDEFESLSIEDLRFQMYDLYVFMAEVTKIFRRFENANKEDC